jgi:hypothetical protein
MGIFSKKKIIDYTEGYSPRRNRAPSSSVSSESSSSSDSSGGFFEMAENSREGTVGEYYSRKQSSSEGNFESLDAEEKRRRLARRLKNMTDKMEDLSNSIYLLQQRIEVLEKKTNVSSYDKDEF